MRSFMMQIRYFTELATPVGPVTIVSDGSRITLLSLRPAADVVTVEPRVDWREAGTRAATARDTGLARTRMHGPGTPESDTVLAQARAQIRDYFDGELRNFTLPLAPQGTPFQQEVWSALRDIPFGETTSYGALAAQLGRPGSARAVGAANRQNPIAIVVPCHRVIGTNGTLTGYAGGLERKSLLLDHEARVSGVRLAL
jgi:methylated-DNA-[protein]-cysteine S-methyltransferase